MTLGDFALRLLDRWMDSLRFHRFGVANVRAARRMSPAGGTLFLLWHQSLLSVVGGHRGLRLVAMVSRSGDGGLLTQFLERRGIRSARGSKSRGGAAASLEMLRCLRQGDNAVSSIDGPRGPFKQPQAGVIDIARRAGVPIILVAVRSVRESTLKRAWDRIRIPWPCTHVAVGYSEPIMFPPEDPDADELERRRRMVAMRLHDLEADLSRRTGHGDTYPLAADLAWLNS